MSHTEFLYKRAQGLLVDRDYTIWAIGLLESGGDFPEAAFLAGLSLDAELNRHEVEHYFQLCAARLGLGLIPDPEIYFEDYIKRVCLDMMAGKVKLDVWREALRQYWVEEEIYTFCIWNDLAMDIRRLQQVKMPRHIFNEGLTIESLDEFTISLAKQFAALLEADHPNCFPFVWICLECGFVDEQTSTTSPGNWCGSECMDPAGQRRACDHCGKGSLLNMRYFKNREAFLARRTIPRKS